MNGSYENLQHRLRTMDLDAVMANSYRNFHTKDFDYICLKRTKHHTVKVYFLDGDASKLPEVVNPHDHRYTFNTTVLAGKMMDYRFVRDAGGDVYQAFDYMTPLNGGNGFTYRGEERLKKIERRFMVPGDVLATAASHLHTIRMAEDQTVILLDQYADEVPIDMSTSTWVRKGEPKPDTTGLYDRFTEDSLFKRLSQLDDILSRLSARSLPKPGFASAIL